MVSDFFRSLVVQKQSVLEDLSVPDKTDGSGDDAGIQKAPYPVGFGFF